MGEEWWDRPRSCIHLLTFTCKGLPGLQWSVGGSLSFADGVCHCLSCLCIHAPESFPWSLLKGLWLRFPGRLSSALLGTAPGMSLALGVSGKVDREGSTFWNSGQGNHSKLGSGKPAPVCTFASKVAPFSAAARLAHLQPGNVKWPS